MATCMSCKNKQSDDRCTNPSLKGLIYCGVHSRAKNPRNWSKINGVESKTIKIQKTWKGHFTRKRLFLAGPGVLSRSMCNNSDEIISLEPISIVHPFDYFGFNESGKIYGFDIRTIVDALHRTGQNPFTRQPISIEIRRRIREIYGYRLRNRLENYYEHNIFKTPDTLLQNRWVQVCQIIEENGFFDTTPNTFINLNKSQLFVLLSMVYVDVETWALEHNPKLSKRFQYLLLLKNAIKKFNHIATTRFHSFNVASVLSILLYDCIDCYNICFIIMSALYRL